MLQRFVSTCVFAGCLLPLSMASGAQEIIHALTGTVASIDSATKTISVLQDNGARGEFQLKANPKTRIAFDKRIEAGSIAAEAFDKQGAYVTRRPVAPADVAFTVFDALGIDPHKQIVTPDGRPIEILDAGDTIRELYS